MFFSFEYGNVERNSYEIMKLIMIQHDQQLLFSSTYTIECFSVFIWLLFFSEYVDKLLY